ncbi:MAG: cobalamin-dependent protein [Coriobacteriia bacterium]|nr:cobalamin-dependent protein [Coriobacteriia bacterium]
MNKNTSDTPASPPRTPDELRRIIAESLDALDRARAVDAALDAVARGDIDVADLYTLVLGPYLTEVGSQWQHGQERVWQEHFASHAIRTIVEALYPEVARKAAEAPSRHETVLLVCPPNEEHELGLRMLSDRFEMAGYRSVFLGADTPIAEIVEAAGAVHATIVALSISTVFERVELRCFVDTLHERLAGTRIIVGGPALKHDPGGWAAEELLDPSELGLPGASATR